MKQNDKPSWEKGIKRKFRCIGCNKKPPEIIYNHSISSIWCLDCQLKIVVIFGVFVLFVIRVFY